MLHTMYYTHVVGITYITVALYLIDVPPAPAFQSTTQYDGQVHTLDDGHQKIISKRKRLGQETICLCPDVQTCNWSNGYLMQHGY